MKTLNVLLNTLLVGATVFCVSCSEQQENNETLEVLKKSTTINSPTSPLCTYDGKLTDNEVSSIKLVREKEKMAYEVYLKFDQDYNNQIFARLLKSESNHNDAMLRLITGYKLEDSANSEIGSYNNTEVSALYKSLTTKAKAGLTEALKASAELEDLYINDLNGLIAESKNTDVVRVYSNLLRGAKNHLKAIVNTLTSLDESYVPQYISTELFDEILAQQNGRGKGNGNGQGNKNGNGKRRGKGSGNGSKNGGQSGNCDGTRINAN